jgi:hypothetical protein
VPEYRVLVYAADLNDFGFGPLLHEFTDAKNIGFAYYLNDIGEAFWTVNQDDHRVLGMRPYFGTAHVVITRNNEAVWRGVLSELDANNEDVILYAYGYEHILYHLLSKWNHSWEKKKIAGASGRPVDDLWAFAQSKANSQLEFATTGTLQPPVTTSGGSTDIVLETYKLYYKRILHALKELVAIAVSDTTNVCYFELDYGTNPATETLTFNFWKNNTEDTPIELQYPGLISKFSDRYVPIYTRNELISVAYGARDQLLKKSILTTGGTFGSTNFGLRQEPIYINWVRDEAELDRVTKFRKSKAIREDVNMYVRLQPNAGFLPARATGSGYEMGDRIRINIDRGITQIDKMLFIEGEQVIVVQGVEYVQPLLADRPGG